MLKLMTMNQSTELDNGILEKCFYKWPLPESINNHCKVKKIGTAKQHIIFSIMTPALA